MEANTKDAAALIAEVEGLLSKLGDSARVCRVYAGIPCQSENAWHADDYDDIAAVLRRSRDLVLALSGRVEQQAQTIRALRGQPESTVALLQPPKESHS